MLKKIIVIALSLCLVCSITVMSVNASPEGIDQATIESSNGKREGKPQMDRTPPEGFVPSGDFAPPQGGMAKTTEETAHQTENNETPQMPQMQGGNRQFGGQMGGMGRFPGGFSEQNTQTDEEKSFVKEYATPITSGVLLVLAFIFVIFYRRKNY